MKVCRNESEAVTALGFASTDDAGKFDPAAEEIKIKRLGIENT